MQKTAKAFTKRFLSSGHGTTRFLEKFPELNPLPIRTVHGIMTAMYHQGIYLEDQRHGDFLVQVHNKILDRRVVFVCTRKSSTPNSVVLKTVLSQEHAKANNQACGTRRITIDDKGLPRATKAKKRTKRRKETREEPDQFRIKKIKRKERSGRIHDNFSD